MTFTVTFEGCRRVVVADGDIPILDCALAADLPLPHDCRSGGCGSCRIKLIEGSVSYPDDEIPMGLTPEEAEAGYILACQARPLSDLVVEALATLSPTGEARPYDSIVRSVRTVAPEIVHLSLELEDQEAADFVPGQYADIHVDNEGRRSFSMASAPNKGELDFYIRRQTAGRFTDGRLASLRPGDRVSLDMPLGGFRLRVEDYRPLVLVAAGTGIAPMKAILESLLDDDDCPPVALYWGMRSEDHLFLDAQIRGWADRLYEFRYVPVLSRASARWSGARGYVHNAVIADLPDLSEYSVYVCGAPQMVFDAKQAFLQHGASAAHLYAEGFTLQHDSLLATNGESASAGRASLPGVEVRVP